MSILHMPINCPKCNGALLNEFKSTTGLNCLHKTCYTKLDHKIEFIASIVDGSHNTTSSVCLDSFYLKGTSIVWYPIMKSLWYFAIPSTYGKRSDFEMPYFEPDFSDFKKLISKLKTYIIFS
jgi:hypothetical protein